MDAPSSLKGCGQISPLVDIWPVWDMRMKGISEEEVAGLTVYVREKSRADHYQASYAQGKTVVFGRCTYYARLRFAGTCSIHSHSNDVTYLHSLYTLTFADE